MSLRRFSFVVALRLLSFVASCIVVINLGLAMCSEPIQINRTLPDGSTRVDVVPCGKCSECKSAYRSGIAALCAHQAMVSGSMFFFTLTYDDVSCPVAISLVEKFSNPDNSEDFFFVPRVFAFERGCSDWNCEPLSEDKHFLNRVLPIREDWDGYYRCCSLYREDVKNWLKAFRKSFKSKFGEDAKFKYIFFGELGEKRGRPHYHGLVFGLSREAAELLRSLWHRGDCRLDPQLPHPLTIEEIGKMTNYVSKYASKGIHSRFASLLPYIEKPRRQSSLDFGQFTQDEIDKLRSMMPATCHRLDKYQQLLNEGKGLFITAIHMRCQDR